MPLARLVSVHDNMVPYASDAVYATGPAQRGLVVHYLRFTANDFTHHPEPAWHCGSLWLRLYSYDSPRSPPRSICSCAPTLQT